MKKRLYESRNKKYCVSVIIPTYKNQDYLEECINSIIESTKVCEHYEILIGIDNCFDTLNFAANNDIFLNKNIGLYFFEKNVGPYIIRNTLAQKSKYENILFFDSDDVMMENTVKILLKNFVDKKILKFKFYNFYDGKNYKHPENLTISRIFSHGSFLIKKDHFLEMNGFFGWKCGADAEFNERYVGNGFTIPKLDEPLYYRRYHTYNLTRRPDTGINSELRNEYDKIIIDRRTRKDWSNPETIDVIDFKSINGMNDANLNEDIHQYPIKPTHVNVHREILLAQQSNQNECNNTVVYTCISGNYDILRDVVNPESDIDYICFTDLPIESNTWKIRPIPQFLKSFDPTKIARCIKILPHLFLSEYETSVWIDGNIQVLGDIKKFINQNLKNYFAIPKHPLRKCVYEEGTAVIDLKKDCSSNVNVQINLYKSKNYPKNNGMVQSNVIIRKHNDKRCVEISNTWWTHVRLYSKRDQLSFNYCIWKKNVSIDIINPNVIVGNHFQQWSHIHKKNKKVVLNSDYGSMKNYINGVEV